MTHGRPLAVHLYVVLLFSALLPRCGAEGNETDRTIQLLQDLNSSDAHVRWAACSDLAWDADPRLAVPALAQAMRQDSVERVRAQAAEALGQIGPPAISAVPALLEATQDERGAPDYFSNVAAVKALARIGPDAIPLLKDALCSEYAGGAGKALAEMGPPALPVLIEGLKHEGCRVGAIAGMGVMKGDLSSAVPALIAAATDNDRVVRYGAVSTLGRIGPQAEKAVPLLVASLGDSEKYVREAAASALGAIGPAAHVAIPALREALKDPDVRGSAERALKALEASSTKGL